MRNALTNAEAFNNMQIKLNRRNPKLFVTVRKE